MLGLAVPGPATGVPLVSAGATRAAALLRSATDADATTRPRYRPAIAVIIALLAVAVVVTPLANRPLRAIPGALTSFVVAMIVINLVLSALLFSRGMASGQASSVRLGTAYCFSAFILMPLMASFPGALLPTPVLSGPMAAVWLWYAWHFGFSLSIIRFTLVPDAVPASVPHAIVACLLAVMLLTLASTFALPYLPVVMVNGNVPRGGIGETIALTGLALNVVALILVLWRRKSGESIWLIVALTAATLEIWLAYYGSGLYTLGWYVSKCASMMASLTVLLWLLHGITILHHRMAAANEMLTTLAHRDGLTGLANRRRFDEVAHTEWLRARREHQPLSVVMIDVDHFKRLNDRYGHLQGDDCLRLIGETLAAVTRRPGDLAARYGGEEFVMLLPATDVFGAVDAAQAVHVKLRELAIAHVGSPLGVVTVSIGVASMPPRADYPFQKLLSLADANLYIAKQSGRNQTRAGVEDGSAALATATG